MRQRQISSCLRSGDRGALTLSYVMLLPFLFLFLMILIQASFWFLARQAALAAARQGADAARVLGADSSAGSVAALAFARKSGAGYLLGPTASNQGSSATTV